MIRRYRRLRADLQRIRPRRIAAFAAALPGFFCQRITISQAENAIKRGLDRRETGFLEIIRTRVYGDPNSPYLRLLEIAGCEFPDFCDSIHRHGIEGALGRLAQEGVYLTSEEFKGKKDVERSGQSFRVTPYSFERADLSRGFTIESSGTRNVPVRSVIPLDWLTVRAFVKGAFLSAHGLLSHRHAIYDGILPASGGINHLLMDAILGLQTHRWFARRIPVRNWLDGKYHHLMTWMIVLTGKIFCPGFPSPEFTDVGDLHRIVDWVVQEAGQGRVCCIRTSAGNAARIAGVALQQGVPLTGTMFLVGGEPLTDAKHARIEQVGAAATANYAYGGGINLGFGCANPLYIDEIHVNQHLVALLPRPWPLAIEDPPVHPLLATTLHPLAPRLLLNVENGDYVSFLRRDCGCGLEKLGLTLHLHRIRSFEKFTSEGMNYFYVDLFEVLEKTLPAEFGGGPGDYQLVEEEDGAGLTRLILRVRPEVGQVDEARLLNRLQAALRNGARDQQFMARLWQTTETLRIRREAPYASPRGKILPLHIPQ
jgi:hypothetical protein